MSDNSLNTIEKKIEALINDRTNYTYVEIKNKVEEILKAEDIFFKNNKLDTKAFDLYFARVVSKRNQLQKQEEQTSSKPNSSVTKYDLIEQICKKLEFESKEELILKVEELEIKSFDELIKIKQDLE